MIFSWLWKQQGSKSEIILFNVYFSNSLWSLFLQRICIHCCSIFVKTSESCQTCKEVLRARCSKYERVTSVRCFLIFWSWFRCQSCLWPVYFAYWLCYICCRSSVKTPPLADIGQLSVFESVREITGALVVQADHINFTSLSFLKNLRSIVGRQLQ